MIAFQMAIPHHRSFLKCGYTRKKSKRGRRANQVKSSKASHAIQEKSQVSRVKEIDTQEEVMLDQDMLDADMLVWSSNSSQVSPDKQEKLMLIQHMLDVNMLAWSSNSSQLNQDTEEKSRSFNTCCMSTCLAATNCLPMRLAKNEFRLKGFWSERCLV